MNTIKPVFSLAFLSVLFGCTATPQNIPEIVDKGMPETSLTLADMRQGRHAPHQHLQLVQTARPAAEQTDVQVFVPKTNGNLSVMPLEIASAAPASKPEPTAVAKKAIAVMPGPPAQLVKQPIPAPSKVELKKQQAPVVVDVQMRIHKLTEGYIQGNLEDAYELGKLLAQVGRDEEADVVLDYASRQGHVASRKLQALRLKENGQPQMAKSW